LLALAYLGFRVSYIQWMSVLSDYWSGRRHPARDSQNRDGPVSGRGGSVSIGAGVVDKQIARETERQGESGGLLSGAVYVVGEIPALPFRRIGGRFASFSKNNLTGVWKQREKQVNARIGAVA